VPRLRSRFAAEVFVCKMVAELGANPCLKPLFCGGRPSVPRFDANAQRRMAVWARLLLICKRAAAPGKDWIYDPRVAVWNHTREREMV